VAFGASVFQHGAHAKEHVFFMRKKAEELYLAFETYDRNLTVIFSTSYRAIKGASRLGDT